MNSALILFSSSCHRLVGYAWSVRYKRIAYRCTIYYYHTTHSPCVRLCFGVYIYKLINNHGRRRFSGRVQSCSSRSAVVVVNERIVADAPRLHHTKSRTARGGRVGLKWRWSRTSELNPKRGVFPIKPFVAGEIEMSAQSSSGRAPPLSAVPRTWPATRLLQTADSRRRPITAIIAKIVFEVYCEITNFR